MNCSFSIYFKATLCPLLATASAVSLLQNVIFCGIVWNDKSLHKRSLILVVNLSVAGIFNALTVPVFEFIYVYCYPSWPLGKLGTNVQNSIWLFSLVLPFTTVTCITIERYLATVKNIFYRTNITAPALRIVVFFLWVYSLAWTVVLSAHFMPAPDTYYVWNVPHELYYIFLGFHLIVPLLVITVLYGRILIHSRNSKRDVSVLGEVHSKAAVTASEVKLAKTVALVIGCLYAVWIPVVIMEVVYNFDFDNCIVEQTGSACVFVTSLNGCLYPLIYFYRIKEVKKNLTVIWTGFSSKVRALCFCWLLLFVPKREHGSTTERMSAEDDYDKSMHPYTMVEDGQDVSSYNGPRNCGTPFISKASS